MGMREGVVKMARGLHLFLLDHLHLSTSHMIGSEGRPLEVSMRYPNSTDVTRTPAAGTAWYVSYCDIVWYDTVDTYASTYSNMNTYTTLCTKPPSSSSAQTTGEAFRRRLPWAE